MVKVKVLFRNRSKSSIAQKETEDLLRNHLEDRGLSGIFQISVIICGDQLIHKLNREYRKIDRVTDVLSFPLAKMEGAEIANLGDIVVCHPQTKRQVGKFGANYYEEFAFLLKHGLDHLLDEYLK